MEKIITAFAALIGGLVLIALGAVVSGTLIWLLWPAVIPAVFPGIVAGGFVAAKLAWWKAVMFTWLWSMLFKPSTTVNKNED